MKSILVLFVGLFLLASGCASNVQSLQRESARSIGNNLKANEITVTEINRSTMNVDWKATTPDGVTFDCSADDMVRRVNCTQ